MVLEKINVRELMMDEDGGRKMLEVLIRERFKWLFLFLRY